MIFLFPTDDKIALHGSTKLHKAKTLYLQNWGKYTDTFLLLFQNILQKWDPTICINLQLAFSMKEYLFCRNFDLSICRSSSFFLITCILLYAPLWLYPNLRDQFSSNGY